MSAADHAPERIVIRMPNWLGDAVMSVPAAAAVRAAYSGAWLTVAAIPSIAPIFEEDTGVSPQQILTVEKSNEAATLRAGRFDTILLLPNSFGSAWSARRSGIPHRWGYAAAARGPLLTRTISRPRTAVHQSTYYAELVRGLGLTVGEALPRIVPTERTRARAQAMLSSTPAESGGVESATIGFAPGAAYGHAKRWPPERVAEVITRLVRERQARCILVGADADREAGRAIESSLPSGVSVSNLIGRTDLRLLIGVLAQCHAFVSNDSGAMHLAAAAGVPVTAIFGPTNEKATAPLGDHDVLLHPVFCRPCMLRECPIDHRCMKRIPASRVFDSVTRRL